MTGHVPGISQVVHAPAPGGAVKSLAIAFALISLLFAALAATEWAEPPANTPGRERPDRGGRTGGLILFVVSIYSAAALYVGAKVLGWPRDRTLWVGVGAMLALMTLARPWWFWENYRARWLRNLIGDEPTAGLYLALAAAMMWVGLFTDWTFGRP